MHTSDDARVIVSAVEEGAVDVRHLGGQGVPGGIDRLILRQSLDAAEHIRRPYGDKCRACAQKHTCEFFIHIDKEEQGMLAKMYKDCEHVDGYVRDRCLLADVIDIEDAVSVNVKYRKSAVMSYSPTSA